MLYVSQVPLKDGRIVNPGTLGQDLTIEQGQQAAKQAALNILAVVNDACRGTIDCIDHVIRIDGFVASTSEFEHHSKVLNGASDFLVSVLSENGEHVRAAVGSVSLPAHAAVELSAVIKLKRDWHQRA